MLLIVLVATTLRCARAHTYVGKEEGTLSKGADFLLKRALIPQSEQEFRRVGLATALSIARVDGEQIELGNRVHHEACQVVGRQTVTQPHPHVQCRVVISRFEASPHTCQWSTDYPNPRVLLSGRLLVDDYSASEVGNLPGHRTRSIGGHKGRYIRELDQRGRASRVTHALNGGLVLLPSDTQRLGVKAEDDVDRFRLRDPGRAQADRADAVRSEFRRQGS